MNCTRKISVYDQITGENSDSFDVDLESLPIITDKDASPNPGITRSLSRKGSQRAGAEKTANPNVTTAMGERENIVSASSPRGTSLGPDMPYGKVVGTTPDRPGSPRVHHHQITITAANVNTFAESRSRKLYGFKRSSSSSSSPWGIDSRKVLIFFATLSSLGSLMLIYFTLSADTTPVPE